MNDKLLFHGIYHIQPKTSFPCNQLRNLLDNVLGENWFIPVKQDEELGICLTAAIDLAKQGTSLNTIGTYTKKQ
jgi:sulfopyruvate decarboxylase TPP-binding subunit